MMHFLSRRSLSVGDDLYRDWYSDDGLMLRRLDKLLADGGYRTLSADIPQGWGRDERRLLPVPKGG